jgi:hypothetical protein
MASVLRQTSIRGESSPVSFMGKRHQFCGEMWGLAAINYRYKKT